MNEDTEDLTWMLKACENVEDISERLENHNKSSKEETPPHVSDPTVLKDCNLSASSLETSTKKHYSEEYSKLKKLSDKNQEVLRKLKLVKFHKNKNNLDTLNLLIKKWQLVCEKALTELLQFSSKQPPTTMLQLIQHLGIDPEQVQFDVTANAFFTEIKRESQLQHKTDLA